MKRRRGGREMDLKQLDTELLETHDNAFGCAYPCGYVDYCDYCDIDDIDFPCAKAKIRMEERNERTERSGKSADERGIRESG